MKKFIALVLIILSILCLTSCDVAMSVLREIDIPFIHIDKNGPGVYEFEDFADGEKSLFEKYVGEVIPFIPCDEYYVEGYYYPDNFEHGINFYTEGNTKEEFLAYLDLFTDYTLTKSYTDTLGDEQYRLVKDDVVVEISYYRLIAIPYVDVYVYSSLSKDVEHSVRIPSENLTVTNEGKGLPEGKDGVYKVDLTKGEYAKDVTELGKTKEGCPTTGSPAVLVIPVEFSDKTAKSEGYTIDAIKNAFLKNGKNDYLSLYDYYYASSYGKLSLDITVLDFWFMPEKKSRHYYRATEEIDGMNTEIGDQLVLNEALDYLDDIMDLTKFDSDGNGKIDSVVLINTLDIKDRDFNWAYRYWNEYTDEDGSLYKYDGVSAYDYIWASYQFLYETYDDEGYSYYDTPAMNTYTYIHEFGHVLGADDYYDTEYLEAPMSGNDVMDMTAGDHNAYTKFNLGWINESRLVVTDNTVTLTLADFGKTGDTLIIANDWDEKLGAYQEYYVIVYYKNTGLNSGDAGYFDREGVVVYHVNSSLYPTLKDGKTVYDVYNNNTSAESKYGTVNYLIEYIQTDDGDFIFGKGDILPDTYTDAGELLGYTFRVDSITESKVTLTFTNKSA